MMIRTDPFQVLDRLTQQLNGRGTWSGPSVIPMDAYRSGEEFVVAFDLPGVEPEAIEVNVDRNVLTVKAERRPIVSGDDVQTQISERPLGVFSRQVFLGENLDTDAVEASYEAGVLKLRIPVAQQHKARKIEISSTGQKQLSS
ncbi:Hsp20/alpha crystallin family protein [Kribbella sp. NPDC006257]|uniref:Hsp20/alpha crystallin family protein n=1 Tax=Kribbella sp. NPDC006257 TaxID=3156738 RepID=UPI0033A64EB6